MLARADVGRDYRKLRVFNIADATLLDVYRVTARFPPEERYVLQNQLRRAAVSVATIIVEGSARRSQREYVNFLNVANGSTAEALYLLSVARRLELLAHDEFVLLSDRYAEVTRGLQAMIHTLASG